eukprot:gene1544-929_t
MCKECRNASRRGISLREEMRMLVEDREEDADTNSTTTVREACTTRIKSEGASRISSLGLEACFGREEGVRKEEKNKTKRKTTTLHDRLMSIAAAYRKYKKQKTTTYIYYCTETPGDDFIQRILSCFSPFRRHQFLTSISHLNLKPSPYILVKVACSDFRHTKRLKNSWCRKSILFK